MSGARKVDWSRTYQKYKERMTALPDEEFRPLDGAYLGTFELYSVVQNVEPGTDMDCFAAVLLRVAREKGFSPKGLASERKSKGQYICSNLLESDTRENSRVVYVGKFSYFSGHQRSFWAPVAADYVRITCGTTTNETTDE